MNKNTFELAVQNHQKNNLEVAENLYKKILEKDPNHFQSICFLGTLSIQIKNFERAKKLLNKAIGIQPNNANVNNNLGIVNNELEDYQKAINNDYDEWQNHTKECLALIIILDQFSRNLFRNNSKAFVMDAKARLIANEAIDRCYIEKLSTDEILFIIF